MTKLLFPGVRIATAAMWIGVALISPAGATTVSNYNLRLAVCNLQERFNATANVITIRGKMAIQLRSNGNAGLAGAVVENLNGLKVQDFQGMTVVLHKFNPLLNHLALRVRGLANNNDQHLGILNFGTESGPGIVNIKLTRSKRAPDAVEGTVTKAMLTQTSLQSADTVTQVVLVMAGEGTRGEGESETEIYDVDFNGTKAVPVDVTSLGTCSDLGF